jgi:hypothetical protein
MDWEFASETVSRVDINFFVNGKPSPPEVKGRWLFVPFRYVIGCTRRYAQFCCLLRENLSVTLQKGLDSARLIM